MASKYDLYWAERLEEIRAAVQAAAAGAPADVDVPGLRRLGARQSWYGSVEVRGRTAARASMAHAVSLGRTVAASGICMPWPELTFRFTINQADLLTIAVATAAVPGRAGAPSVPPRPSSAVSQRAASGGRAAAEADGHVVDAAAGCARIHGVLATLPSWTQPAAVPFANGLYFFYERGELSPHAPGGRIVRIGNHPLAQDRLVGRLRDHYSHRLGAKNFSVFRRYLGGALLRRNDPDGTCLRPGPGQGHWEKQGGRACPLCEGMEQTVSEQLSLAFTFCCVHIEDRAERNEFEKRLIATVATCPHCHPSSNWLGRHAYPQPVQGSGLWNVQHTGGQLATSQQLHRFEELADMSQAGAALTAPGDLSRTLLIIPCSGEKKGAADPGLPVVTAADLLGPAERQLLLHGRQLAFARPDTSLDTSIPVRPALSWYTGQPYKTSGVPDALAQAIRRGLHCLIISAGYGIVRPEEPIHLYNAQITQTQTVWKARLPAILGGYVHRQQINRSFVLLSRQYAECVPELTPAGRRFVPTFTRGQDPGSAIRVVPSRIGAELSKLLGEFLGT